MASPHDRTVPPQLETLFLVRYFVTATRKVNYYNSVLNKEVLRFGFVLHGNSGLQCEEYIVKTQDRSRVVLRQPRQRGEQLLSRPIWSLDNSSTDSGW